MGLPRRDILSANLSDAKRVMMMLKKKWFSGISGASTLVAAFLDDPAFHKLDLIRLKLSIAGGMAL